jgi:hypothetical protein
MPQERVLTLHEVRDLTLVTLPLSSRMSGTLRANEAGVRASWFALISAISSLRRRTHVQL